MVKSPERFEYKITLPSCNLAIVESMLRCHPMCFSSSYSDRRVNNIYFDSLRLDSLNENLDGKSLRSKIRLRWYSNADRGLPEHGLSAKTGPARLEVKNKRDGHGWKLNYDLPAGVNLLGNDWSSIFSEILHALPTEMQTLFVNYDKAVLINQYRRSYYEDFDKKCRITIDSNLYFFNQWMNAKPNLLFHEPLAEYIVLEFKSNVSDVGLLRDSIQFFPYSISKHSKYVSWTERSVVFP